MEIMVTLDAKNKYPIVEHNRGASPLKTVSRLTHPITIHIKNASILCIEQSLRLRIENLA